MSFLDKLKFWKSDSDFDLPPPDMSMPQVPVPDDQMFTAPQMGGPPQSAGITEPPDFSSQESVQDRGASRPLSFQQREFSSARQLSSFQSQAVQSSDQQLQLISSKLDTVKAQLDAVLQRLDRLDKVDRKDDFPWQARR